jgi:hypothetical protein
VTEIWRRKPKCREGDTCPPAGQCWPGKADGHGPGLALFPHCQLKSRRGRRAAGGAPRCASAPRPRRLLCRACCVLYWRGMRVCCWARSCAPRPSMGGPLWRASYGGPPVAGPPCGRRLVPGLRGPPPLQAPACVPTPCVALCAAVPMYSILRARARPPHKAQQPRPAPILRGPPCQVALRLARLSGGTVRAPLAPPCQQRRCCDARARLQGRP